MQAMVQCPTVGRWLYRCFTGKLTARFECYFGMSLLRQHGLGNHRGRHDHRVERAEAGRQRAAEGRCEHGARPAAFATSIEIQAGDLAGWKQ